MANDVAVESPSLGAMITDVNCLRYVPNSNADEREHGIAQPSVREVINEKDTDKEAVYQVREAKAK